MCFSQNDQRYGSHYTDFSPTLRYAVEGLCGRMSEGTTSEENLEYCVMFRPDEVRLLNSNAAEIKVLYIIP